MVPISRIEVELTTSNVLNADSDGDAYLGICGREFYLVRDDIDNYERGRRDTYIFGGSTANTTNKSENDPRNPQLYAENLPEAASIPGIDNRNIEELPVYIRFEPLGANPAWKLERVAVRVFVGNQQVKGFYHSGGLWLGQKSGKFRYLIGPLLGQI